MGIKLMTAGEAFSKGVTKVLVWIPFMVFLLVRLDSTPLDTWYDWVFLVIRIAVFLFGFVVLESGFNQIFTAITNPHSKFTKVSNQNPR